jgi:hypothetical protein
MDKTYLKVYFAAPYTNPDPELNTSLYFKLVALTCKLWQIDDPGLVVVPVLPHAYHLLEQHVPRPYDEWMRVDQELIKGCHMLVRFPGESSGAEQEVAYARSMGIDIRDYHNNQAKPLGTNMVEAIRRQQAVLDLLARWYFDGSAA